jgi:hypothetical protein
METGTAQFVDYLFTVPNMSIVTSVWVFLGLLHAAFPSLKMHPIYARFLPFLPILLASAAVWIPGAVVLPGATPEAMPDDPTIATRIFLGICLGALAGQGNKIFKQTVMGRDERIEGT